MSATKKAVKVKVVEAWPGQRDMLAKLAGQALPKGLERIQSLGQPYQGELSAPMSQQEGQGLDILSQYLSGEGLQGNAMFGAAKGELADTLSGKKYDPSGGEYYQAFRNTIMRELQDAKDRINASTSARDKFFGGGRIEATGRTEEVAMNNLTQFLGQLAQQERQNRLTAAPLAAQMGMTETQEPLQRIAASQQYGALPRTLEQASMNRQYTEFQRQLKDMNIALDILTGLGGLSQTPYAIGGGNKGWVDDTANIVDMAGVLGLLIGKKG